MKYEILKKIIDFIKSIFGKKKEEKTKATKKNNATKRSTKKNK